MYTKFLKTLACCLYACTLIAQNKIELDKGWMCTNIQNARSDGNQISRTSYPLKDWMLATVPGTVLTTLINNHKTPDPFCGLNNQQIPDIFSTGRDTYTYWFINDFKTSLQSGQQVWLHLRGINYSCDLYLNGHKLNPVVHKGMLLRQRYNITSIVNANETNRLAIIVYPPDHVGNPNGGQGGDGEIARGVTHQYVAGWDWIQPIPDRNTGIWDKVIVEKPGAVDLSNPHVVTIVPGIRKPDDSLQQPALIKMSVEAENAGENAVSGTIKYSIAGNIVSLRVTLEAHEKRLIQLPDYSLTHPLLWWPNGYGPQHLYTTAIVFEDDRGVSSDTEPMEFGVREITTTWNTITRSRQAWINGQPIFLKGGNWIT